MCRPDISVEEESIKKVAENLRDLLLEYYTKESRFVVAIDDVLTSTESEVPKAIGRIGWSGMGSFVDSVFCDIEWKKDDLHILQAIDFRLRQYMFQLGSYALEHDSDMHGHAGMTSTLKMWGPAERLGL